MIVVNPFKIKTAKYLEAMEFAAFLTSARGQKVIGDFKGKSNRQLFEPMADKPGIDLIK